MLLELTVIMLMYYLIRVNFEPSGTPPSILDCFYWTIITVTTLGYYPPELTLVSAPGMLLTMATVLSGILLIFVGLPTIAAPWLERKMEMAIAPRKIPLPTHGHVIVCGFTEVARQTIKELMIHDVPCLVVVNDPPAEARLTRERIPHIIGDPTDSKTLTDAGIGRALSLVVSVDDSTNAFVCLTASKLRPKLRIISNLEKEENENILVKAGVSKVISSKSMTGILLAKRALGQYDLDIITRSGFLGGLEIRQFKITDKSPLRNQTLRSARIGQHSGASVIGTWTMGNLVFNPKPDTVLVEGTILVVMGTGEQLATLTKLIYGGDGHG